jgi:hypothetical protein
MLIAIARALTMKKARMIVFAAQPMVQESLDHVRLGDIIPVVANEAEALRLLNA